MFPAQPLEGGVQPVVGGLECGLAAAPGCEHELRAFGATIDRERLAGATALLNDPAAS